MWHVEPIIRAASLHGFFDLVHRLGGDPVAFTTLCGLDSDAARDGVGYLPITLHDLMLDMAAQELHTPDFGLQLAGMQTLDVLGPLSDLIAASDGAAAAWQAVEDYMFVHSPALRLSLHDDPLRSGGVLLAYRKDLSESFYSPQAIELGLGVTYRICRQLLGEVRGLRGIDVPHAPLSPVGRYTQFFGVPVRFATPVAGLRIDTSLFDAEFATADAARRAGAIGEVTRLRNPNLEMTSRVRRAVAQALGVHPVTLVRTSALFAMHSRTLQRRLAAEGQTFDRIVDDVRRTASTRYLRLTDLPIGRVAEMVGFDEQASLSRAMRRWYGTSPSDYRTAHAMSGKYLPRLSRWDKSARE